MALAQTPTSESFTGYYAGTGLAVTAATYPTDAIKNALLGVASLMVSSIDYATNAATTGVPIVNAAVNKCTVLPCVGDGSNPTYPYIYYMVLDNTKLMTDINPTNNLPYWHSNEKDNKYWLVGCDYNCQVVNSANTNVINNDNGAATSIAAALNSATPAPSPLWTATTVTYGAAV